MSFSESGVAGIGDTFLGVSGNRVSWGDVAAPTPVDPATHGLDAARSDENYLTLRQVLDGALLQAARGKGAERHANAQPFECQPMQRIAERRGIGFILGQADKKSEEAQGMLERHDQAAAIRELLGAIVYLAGAIIYIERNQ